MESPIEQGIRLHELIKLLKFKQLSFSKAVGVSQGFVTQMVNGKKNISYGFQKKLLQAFPNINILWLLTGEGEVFTDNKLPVAKAVKINPDTETYTKPLLQLDRMLREIMDNQIKIEKILESKDAEIKELKERISKLERTD